MNLLLNEWGGIASRAGISMFVQTAALALVLLTLEVTTRGRLRATLRCALWLLVVFKVLLPPTFSLPTSVAYWMGPWSVAPLRVSAFPEDEMSFATTGAARTETLPKSVHNSAVFASSVPQARLDWGGGLGLIWLMGTAVMSGWIIRRNLVVHRLVCGSHPASADQQRALEEAARRVGLRRWPQLRVTEQFHSPAVCGLFRPVVLLPQGLVEKLSVTALGDVLLHEVIHIHRRDLWLNLPQTWAVALWWWNPFVWLANARVASLREQAVDERVMLLRHGDPATYPATLVEVARHCVSGPALTLSLVGILESRRALRNRVERLLVSPLPSRASLGATGWITVVCVAFLLVPMAFARRVESAASGNPVGSARPTINNEAARDTSAPATGRPPQGYDTNETRLSSNSTRPGGWGLGHRIIKTKLEGIIVPVFEFKDGTLADLVQYLEMQAQALDPEHKGLNFIINEAETAPPVIDPTSGREVALSKISFRPLTPLRNVRLVDALDAMVGLANRPLRYEVQDYAVVFSSPPPEVPELYTRTFHVDTNTFLIGVQAVIDVVLPSESDPKRGVAVQATVRDFLRACGVKFPSPGALGLLVGTGSTGGTDPLAHQSAMFFNERTGVLFVRGTLEELDIIDKAVEALKVAPPEIELEVRFFEVEPNTLLGIKADHLEIDSRSRTMAAALTPTQFKSLLTDLEVRPGTVLLGLTKVRTPAGRQAQIAVVEKRPVVDPISGTGQTFQLRPVLDVTPSLFSGDPSSRLKLVAQLHRVIHRAGQDLESAQVSTMEFSATLPAQDSHTVMMLADIGKSDAASEKFRPIVVLITPIVVDPAGKSVGSDK